MMHGVVFVMAFALSMAINGQQDIMYDTLLSEVSAMKRSIFKLNVELDKIREQHDNMRDELTTMRNNPNPSDKFSLSTLVENEKRLQRKGDVGIVNTIHKRSAYTPSFHLPRNISRVTGAKGEKGDTGTVGPTGPKGDKGTSGIKGNIGSAGTMGLNGPKGNQGRKGEMGEKGLTGKKGEPGQVTTGAKSEKGDSGTKGDRGPAGPMGLKGNQGHDGFDGIGGRKGEKGDKGEQGTNAKVAFTARLPNDIAYIDGGRPLLFSETSLNLGDDYNPATGFFECSVPGVYVFTWSIEINAKHSLTTVIHVNGIPSGFQIASGTTSNKDSRYSTVMSMLEIGDVVSITAYSPTTSGTIIGFMSSTFSGYLLN